MNVQRRHTSPLPPIARFALLSLAAHASLLIAWQYPALFAGQRDSVLSVTLTGAAQPPAPAQVSAMPRPERQRLSEPQSTQYAQTNAALDVRHAEANTAASDAADQPESATDGQGISHEPARAHLQARLLTELARHFSYPDMARRRGWEGTVLLGLSVESDGRLDKIHVARSSGYAVLDRSALNSLSRLGRLVEASAWLDGRGMDMQLPVIYRLIEN